MSTAARVVLVAAIAWGAFAFGAVYPWAYWPLVSAALAVALAGLLAPASIGWRQLDLSGFALALAAVLVACAIQLVPLAWATIDAISPQARTVIVELDLAARQGVTAAHALSIDPGRSLRGLAVLGALALFVVGAARLLSITGAAGVATAIAAIGALLALTGLVQQPLFTGKIYGFWSPLQANAGPFGPFVNKNHFAGWMLMGLPVTLGLLGSYISRDTPRVGRELREKILWLSSPDANAQLLLFGAIAVMTLSLIRTMSRSGMSAAALAVVVVLLSFRRHLTRGKRVVAAVSLSTLIALVVAWAGTSAIASRFASGNLHDLNGRLGVWEDAAGIVRLYPLAGTGLNTYGVATVFYQKFNPSLRYLQAHNDYLQLAAEGGLLVVVPAVICAGVFAWTVRRRFAQETSTTAHWIRIGAVIGLLAIALQETVEFSLQMPGNAFLFALLCAIALHHARKRRRDLCT